MRGNSETVGRTVSESLHFFGVVMWCSSKRVRKTLTACDPQLEDDIRRRFEPLT